jgi:hypothetical protein
MTDDLSSRAAAIINEIDFNPEPPKPLVMTSSAFVQDFVPPDYVVDGLFMRGFFYSFTAMTGAGKTAIALMLAEMMSNRKRRRKLGNRDVEHVRVLYIACENADDVRMRLIGMEHYGRFDVADLDLLIIDSVFDLDRNMDRIVREVTAFGDVGCVFIDTSAAMFQGDEENNNMAALAHAKSQRKLTERLPGRPCVIALNHPTKQVQDARNLLPRGGGAYLNEVDGNFTAWAHDERMSVFSWAGKLRGPDFDPIEFRLPLINAPRLIDSRGRMLPTVVAIVADDNDVREIDERAEFQEQRLLAAMSDNPGKSLDVLTTVAGWPNRQFTFRVMKRLEQQKLVTKQGRHYGLTATGKKVERAGV